MLQPTPSSSALCGALCCKELRTWSIFPPTSIQREFNHEREVVVMEKRRIENRNRRESWIMRLSMAAGIAGEELKGSPIHQRIKGRIKEAGDSIVFLVQDTLLLSRFIFHAVVPITFSTHINSSSSNTSWQSATAQSTFFPIGKQHGSGVYNWLIFFLFRRRWPWLSTFTHESIRKPADHRSPYCAGDVWMMWRHYSLDSWASRIASMTSLLPMWTDEKVPMSTKGRAENRDTPSFYWWFTDLWCCFGSSVVVKESARKGNGWGVDS